MTSLPELKSCSEWMRSLIAGFPWNDERTDESLKRSFACEAAGLLSYEETEKGSFDEQEYGEHVFRLTALGEQLCRTPSPHNKEATIEALRGVRDLLKRSIKSTYNPFEPNNQSKLHIDSLIQIAALNKIIEGEK